MAERRGDVLVLEGVETMDGLCPHYKVPLANLYYIAPVDPATPDGPAFVALREGDSHVVVRAWESEAVIRAALGEG